VVLVVKVAVWRSRNLTLRQCQGFRDFGDFFCLGAEDVVLSVAGDGGGRDCGGDTGLYQTEEDTLSFSMESEVLVAKTSKFAALHSRKLSPLVPLAVFEDTVVSLLPAMRVSLAA